MKKGINTSGYLKEILPKAIFISIAIFLVLLIIRVIYGYEIRFDNNLALNFGYTMLYGLSIYVANAGVFVYLNHLFKKDQFSGKRLIVNFVASFLVTLFVVFLLRIFEEVFIEKQSFTEFIRTEELRNYVVSMIIFVIVSLAMNLFYIYKARSENKVNEQKMIAGTASAKFESLKNQIDPHFLFNSLNVLTSLIDENPENAKRFTISLSTIYRYILEQKDKELVTITEELAFAQTYMNLLKMRFENSLFYELPSENVFPEAKVIPLSLQLLLENTVKHNVVSEVKPLYIRIYIADEYLVIENDLQKKEILQSHQGVGLQNIIDRYGLLTDRKVLIEQSEKIFTVKLPVLLNR